VVRRRAVLRDLLLTLHHDPAIRVCTRPSISDPPPSGACAAGILLGEGSDHGSGSTIGRVDVGGGVPAETKFAGTPFTAWRSEATSATCCSGRSELLLLQRRTGHSWSPRQAVDYGIRRFALHDNRYEIVNNLLDRMMEAAGSLRSRNTSSAMRRFTTASFPKST